MTTPGFSKSRAYQVLGTSMRQEREKVRKLMFFFNGGGPKIRLFISSRVEKFDFFPIWAEILPCKLHFIFLFIHSSIHLFLHFSAFWDALICIFRLPMKFLSGGWLAPASRSFHVCQPERAAGYPTMWDVCLHIFLSRLFLPSHFPASCSSQ